MNFGGKWVFCVPRQRDLYPIRVFAVLLSWNTVGTCWMLTLFSPCRARRGCQPGAVATTSLPRVAPSGTRHRQGGGPQAGHSRGREGRAKLPALGTTARGRGAPAGTGSSRAEHRRVSAGTAGCAGPGPRPAPRIRPSDMQGAAAAPMPYARSGARGSRSRSASPLGL